MMTCHEWSHALSFDAGQVLFSTDELKKKVGIPTKADWAARYNMPVEGPLPPGVPEYDPLLGAGQYNSKALLACRHSSATLLSIILNAPLYRVLRRPDL